MDKAGAPETIPAVYNIPGPSTGTDPSPVQGSAMFRYGAVVMALAMIGVALYCRVRLLGIPLERDEGGFAYIGQQLLNGVSPYHSGNMKVLPGIHVAYAGIMMLFGESPTGIHTGLLAINGLSILLLYLLARRMLSIEGAAVAAGSYAFLSVSESVFGVIAHATHFVILFVLAGLTVLLKGIDRGSTRLFCISGLCLGTSVLMKQHGIFFCLFALCYGVWDDIAHRRPTRAMLRRLTALAAGLAIPYLALAGYMYHNGVFREFWFWTVTYSMEYATDGSAGFFVNLSRYFDCLSNARCFWALALAGLLILACSKRWEGRRRFVVLLLLCSVLAILPGFSFYPHYFVVILPSLALLTGIAFESLPQMAMPLLPLRAGRAAVAALFVSLLLFCLYNKSGYLFSVSPYGVSRTLYGLNPFPESLEIARYIKEHSEPGTQIAVFGSEPQIYFYADRPSATDYLFMYPLVEQQPYVLDMQQEMMREIDRSHPEYIVCTNIPMSWMGDDSVGRPLWAWMEDYLSRQYRQVGVVELAEGAGSRYYWGRDAEHHQPSTEFFMLVYKRGSVS